MSESEELDAEIMQEFFEEAEELLFRLDGEIVELEESPSDDLLATIFRSFHTLKGSAGFLGLTQMTEAAHAGEEILSQLRDGSSEVNPATTGALLEAVDLMREVITQLRRAPDDAATPPPPSTGDSETETTPLRAPATTGDDPQQHHATEGAHSATESLRVDVSLLDRLMAAAGELVLARNSLSCERPARSSENQAALSRLQQATIEVHDAVMSARMQPVSILMSRYRRTVRDIARELGKEVRLTVSGGETELDRAILESLRDPLTHILRNAIDHGIESPDERVSKGKTREGTITISAEQQLDRVIVSICDDGEGIDLRKVTEKARDLGLLGSTDSEDESAYELLFLPGVSTAERVSSISGRGVGMDVVRSAITAVGGSIEVLSVPGEGTTVKLTLPPSLMLVPSLVVTVGSNRYALRQTSVMEIVGLGHDNTISIREDKALLLRGELLPLLDATEVLHEAAVLPTAAVVVMDEGRRYALAVSDVIGVEESVVKPLPRELNSIPEYSGQTVLPDGVPSVLLNVGGIGRAAGITSRSADAAEPLNEEARREVVDVVVFRRGNADLAIEVCEVLRIETVAPLSASFEDGSYVLEYEGDALRLTGQPRPGHADSQALVLQEGGGRVREGLLVDEVLDVRPLEVIAWEGSCDTKALLKGDEGIVRLVDPTVLVGRNG